MSKRLSVWPAKILMVFVLSCVFQNALAQVITYKAPPEIFLNHDFTVKVREKGKNWQPVVVYQAKVDHVSGTTNITENTSFGYFDFNGEAEVAITYNKGIINTEKVRPGSANIVESVTNNTITFSLTEPRNLSIEVNGDIFHNLQLFANPIEKYKPLPADTNVIFFGPGLHRIGTLKVPSNKTVYVSGGAVLQGQVLISQAENIRVISHGILTQLPVMNDTAKVSDTGNPSSRSKPTRNDELTINFSKNVEVDGIIILPHKYSVLIGQSKGVKISDIKSFSSEGNADGLDIFCSTDVAVNNIFMRNADDCIAIYGHRWLFYGNTKNVTVANSILWADVAHPIVIGTHGDVLHPDTLGNMEFNNIDILDQHENQIDYQGCMALNAGDKNLISNIKFQNICIDDIRKGQLINLRVMFNHKYNDAPGAGIENILFKNVSYTGNNANMSVIAGYDDTRKVSNIKFENFKVNGTGITDKMPGRPGYYKTGDMANIFIGEHVEGVSFVQ